MNRDLIKRKRNAHMSIWRNLGRKTAIPKAQRRKHSVHLWAAERKGGWRRVSGERSDG